VSERENEAVRQIRRTGAISIAAGPATAWAPKWRDAMEKTWSTATVG